MYKNTKLLLGSQFTHTEFHQVFGVFDLSNDSEENYYINICPECGAEFDWNGMSKELMEAQEHVTVVRSQTESVFTHCHLMKMVCLIHPH